MKNKVDRYNGDYPYLNNDLLISREYDFPIIERTNNGLLFPEGPQNSVDLKDVED